ncbi:MAG: hypothetical protein AAF928_04025 [Myxococcota bacterium]
MSDEGKRGRIARLVWLKERRRDAAQAYLAKAEAEARAAAEAAEQAEQRFEDAAEDPSAGPLSAWIVARQHVTSLGVQAAGAQTARRSAEEEAGARRSQAHHAERELRKMERWSEAERARARVAGQRKEQGATDELAAQLTERKR